MKRYCPL